MLLRPDTGDQEITFLTRRVTPGLAGYAVVIERSDSCSRSSRWSATWSSPSP